MYRNEPYLHWNHSVSYCQISSSLISRRKYVFGKDQYNYNYTDCKFWQTNCCSSKKNQILVSFNTTDLCNLAREGLQWHNQLGRRPCILFFLVIEACSVGANRMSFSLPEGTDLHMQQICSFTYEAMTPIWANNQISKKIIWYKWKWLWYPISCYQVQCPSNPNLRRQ